MYHDTKVIMYLNESQVYEVLSSLKLTLNTNALEKLPFELEVTVLVILISSLLIGSYFKSAIYLYMYAKKKFLAERPIDILLLVQAIIQHLLIAQIIFAYVTGLFIDVAISEQLGGEAWCLIPWYGANYGAHYRVVGGFVIAGYRLHCLFYGEWIKEKVGRKKLLCLMLTASITIPGMLTLGFGVGNGSISRKQAFWNFCIGKSEEFRTVIHEYSILRGTTTFQPEYGPKIAVMVLMTCVVAELICYLVFFGYMYLHDMRMLAKQMLSTEVIRKRNQKNAMTFFGQFWTFMTECAMLSLVIMSMGEQSDISIRVFAIVAFWAEFGLVSIVEVMTSKSLIKYLPHNLILGRHS